MADEPPSKRSLTSNDEMEESKLSAPFKKQKLVHGLQINHHSIAMNSSCSVAINRIDEGSTKFFPHQLLMKNSVDKTILDQTVPKDTISCVLLPGKISSTITNKQSSDKSSDVGNNPDMDNPLAKFSNQEPDSIVLQVSDSHLTENIIEDQDYYASSAEHFRNVDYIPLLNSGSSGNYYPCSIPETGKDSMEQRVEVIEIEEPNAIMDMEKKDSILPVLPAKSETKCKLFPDIEIIPTSELDKEGDLAVRIIHAYYNPNFSYFMSDKNL